MQRNHSLRNQGVPIPVSQFTTLPDLLPTSTTIPLVDMADEKYIHTLLGHLPPVLLSMGQVVGEPFSTDSTSETTESLKALNLEQKKEILRKVLRSPQFSQSLDSLTVALRDGGLPSIGDALGIPIENGGFMRNSRVPIGGGNAVKAFLNGTRAAVEREHNSKIDYSKDNMDIS